MKLIKNNPYRTVGLLAGATAREQERQVKRLKQFLEAEQEPHDDFSFPVLGPVHRTVESVTEAASKLNLDHDKMNAALFWFYKGNAITDEPAFDALKDSDIQNATMIWTRLTGSGEVTQRNSSAFQNLSTLLLWRSVNGTAVDPSLFEQGLGLKLKFLESDFVNDFKKVATDETFKTTKKDIQLSFLNALQYEVEKRGGITSGKFIDILSRQSFSAREDFFRNFVQKPVEQIEKKIEAARAKRKAGKANAAKAGKELYNAVKTELDQLKSILGLSNLKYASISDKVSDEILQCGIDHFLHYRDSNIDPGNTSMDLFRKAEIFAVGNIAKQRCQENTENLQEWINNKPAREKEKRIAGDLQFITSKLERFQKLPATVANAKDLIDSCKPRLLNIRNELGAREDLYLTISSAIAGNAQGMLVAAVNEAQEGFKNYQLRGGLYFSLSELISIVNGAYDVTTSMQSMDMVYELKKSFQKNREALASIRSQLNRIPSGSSSGGGGCYIATMAYGDYGHPQVRKLRHFRDEVLAGSEAGRLFIKVYYFISPKLVELLKNQKTANALIRKLLNQFIKLIGK